MFRDGRRLNAVIDLREPSVLLGLGARPAGQRVTSVFAAATLVLFYSGFVARPARAVKLVGLILAGYGVLLMPLVVARFTSHELPATLHIWFGPAVVTVWFLSQRTR
jgi:hypothetical protein